MRTKKTHKHIKDQDFKTIKALLTAGVPKLQVSEVTGRSYATITRIEKSATLADYQKHMRAFGLTHNRQKPEALGRDIVAYRLTQIKDLLIEIRNRLQD